MIKNKYIFIFITILFLFNCTTKKSSKVILQLENHHHDTVYLKELTEEPYGYIDSVIINKKGSGRWKLMPSYPAFYSVYVKNDKKQTFTLFIRPGDYIHVKAAGKNFDSLVIEGSPESEEINKLLKRRNETAKEFFAWIDSLHALSDTVAEASKKAHRYDSLISACFQRHREYSIDFLERNRYSPVAIVALQQYIGDRPVFDLRNDFDYFNRIDSILMSRDSTVETVQFLHKQVDYFRAVRKIPDVGNKAPGLSLPDTTGKIISLESLKGKYVLLHFWASFNSASRAYHPWLKRAWWKYHWKGFDLYAVSLDRSRQAWVNAIRQDGLMGYHVSDLKMWNSIAVNQYHFTELPVNYLINPDGVIVYKSIPAEKLDEVLNKIFTQTSRP